MFHCGQNYCLAQFKSLALIGWLLLMVASLPTSAKRSKKVTAITSTVDGRTLLISKINATKFRSEKENTFVMDDRQHYQTMDGFGAAITYSTAYNLMKMTPADRHNFLEETYSLSKGWGYSYARISIGCSDFSSTEYTCCDTPGLENFRLHEDETKYVIPILKEILAINPQLKIIGSPWTCPRWMKVKDLETLEPYNSWTDGYIHPKYYQTYADYFVKWIKAFEAEGIPIYAVTPQNEPLNRANCASTYVSWKEECELVRRMAPTFKRNGLKTKIYVFDHNYNYDNIASEREYPIKLYEALAGESDMELLVGAAYHNYGGNMNELEKIHRLAPNMKLIFSEASIGTWNQGRDLRKSLLRDVEQICIGTVNRWCTAVVVWNLMLDLKRGPNLDGGCQTCFGAVDIDESNYRTIHRNSHYVAIAHLSSVVRPGAVRIGLQGANLKGVSAAAFCNPDRSHGLVFSNSNDAAQEICVRDGHQLFQTVLPAQSVVSFLW